MQNQLTVISSEAILPLLCHANVDINKRQTEDVHRPLVPDWLWLQVALVREKFGCHPVRCSTRRSHRARVQPIQVFSQREIRDLHQRHRLALTHLDQDVAWFYVPKITHLY